MKNLKTLSIITAILFLSSCSLKNKKIEEEISSPQIEEGLTINEELLEQEIVEEAQDYNEMDTESILNENEKLASENQIMNEPTIETSMSSYVVNKGETLMLIAFKIYGDYGKWKELAEYNPNFAQKPLNEGTVITYPSVGESFHYKPDGLPHLVRKGETLGKISVQKYGTSKEWKSIYENNQPLIKDPNLIFAGFTIYYIPKERQSSTL